MCVVRYARTPTVWLRECTKVTHQQISNVPNELPSGTAVGRSSLFTPREVPEGGKPALKRVAGDGTRIYSQ